MTPYEGNKPYIFISYAHKDSDRVYPILDELADRGYRIWYDDGIALGSEWPEYIAEHLNGSDVVMAFITPNSIASANCRREVTFALSKKKEFLAVMLEETEMSLGMEMQLSAQQCVLKYNYKTDAEFYDKLCNDPDLAVCNEYSGITDEPDDEEVSSFAKANAISAEDMKTVEKMEDWIESKENRKNSLPKRVKSNKDKTLKPEKTKKKSILVKILTIVFGSIGAIILLILLLWRSSYTYLSNGDREYRKSSSIYVKEATITKSDLKKIGKMKRLNSLRLIDCDIEGDLADLKNIEQIKVLDLNGSNLSDYGFISRMAVLNKINLNNNKNFKDASLIVSDNVSELILDGTGVSDITPVCEYSTLTVLSIADTGVESVTAPFNSDRLTSLDISGTQIKDLSPFDNLTILENLNISGCHADNSDLITNNSETLTVLDISNSLVDEDTLQAVSLCFGLTALNISDNKFENLKFLGKNSELTALYAVNCGLEDASGVEDLKDLQKLWLNNNKLTDLDISGLRKLSEINIAHNNITSLLSIPSTLEGDMWLAVYDNPADLSTLSYWGDGLKMLATDYDDYLLLSGGSSSRNYYIVDAPVAKQVKLEDITSFHEYFVTADELDRYISESGSLNDYEWPKK